MQACCASIPHLIKETTVKQFCNGIHNSEHNPQLCRQVDDDVQFEMILVGLNRWLQVNKARINSALVASY